MKALSIIVHVGDDAPGLEDLVAGLDAQTAATSDFEVVWAIGTEDVVPERVGTWLGLRPHHRLVRGGTGDALAAAEGAYALAVSATDRFYPDAVESLLTFAAAHSVDAVLARTSAAGAPVPPSLWSDATDLPELPSPGDTSPAPLLMVRRESALVAADGQLGTSDGLGGGVLAAVSVLRRVGSAPSGEPLPTRSAAWDGPELVLEVDPDGLQGPLLGLLQSREDARTHLLPVARNDRAEGVAVVRLDPLDLPGTRGPLGPGGWQLLIQGVGPGSEARVRPVAWQQCPPALVGTTGVVPFTVDQSFALDVGPLRHPLVVVEDPDAGFVQETPFGCRMVVSLPGLHTAHAGDVDVSITVGTLTIPARIVVDGGEARLEAMATGVEGVKPIGLRFGPGGPRSLGLSLQISEVGEMSLVATPAAAPKPAPRATAPGGRRRARPAPRRGVLAAARRRVPAAVEPLVAAASRWEPARRLYRRLTH